MQKLFNKKGIPEHTKQFEDWLQNKIAQRKKLNNFRVQAAPYKIPVVVHIIHNGQAIGTETNIFSSRVLSQIDVLNNDFQRLNTDAINTPAEFLDEAGSLDIEFVLAKQAPDGSATDGIVRVDGGQPTWSPNDNEELKAKSYWPSADYLNIWVTNLSGSNLGYAQFPVSTLPGLEDYQDGLAITDGVVIDYTVFGVGSEEPSYNLGRTVTHEVGHFFGLRHIWGDDNDCSGTDYVSDTPNQEDETYDCPVHPIVDCSTPKMFQNFMDYTDDACMNLFTQGQIERIVTILDDTDVPRRKSLLTSSGLDDPIPGSIDLEIIEVLNPGSATCEETPTLKLNVANLSGGTITELKIKITLNTTVSEITGLKDLAITGQGEISLPMPALRIGENIVSVIITQINGATDPEPANNKIDINVNFIYPECKPFAIYRASNGETMITFDLPATSYVSITIINNLGKSIARLTMQDVLNQTYAIPASTPSNAIYIFRVQIGKKYYNTKIYLSP